jgi:hypothetical protein
MCVDPANASAHQPVPLDECKHFMVAGKWDLRQPLQQRQNFMAAQSAARVRGQAGL